MTTLTVKKKDYEVIEEYGEYSMKVAREGKTYFAKLLGYKTRAYSNFMYAYKRLYNANIVMPKRVVVDKKRGIVLSEFIEGEKVFEDLAKRDLDDSYYSQVFIMSYLARTNRMNLDFDPRNFIMSNGTLYYLSYTFDEYRRDLDFSTNQAKYWFYTKEFRDLLIENHLDIDKSRIKTEYENNKEMVLKVVQFYK